VHGTGARTFDNLIPAPTRTAQPLKAMHLRVCRDWGSSGSGQCRLSVCGEWISCHPVVYQCVAMMGALQAQLQGGAVGEERRQRNARFIRRPKRVGRYALPA
jgi:hypothetical protein